MTEIIDHSAEIERELKMRIGLALEACGLTAEGYAKLNLTEKGAVDTGNLRNSVTHQTDGKEKVYVGTNFHYAPYIEYGTGRNSTIGGKQTIQGIVARPYLKPAVADHKKEYSQIFSFIIDLIENAE